jgi:proteasome lid subunit RPN8/RPN11
MMVNAPKLRRIIKEELDRVMCESSAQPMETQESLRNDVALILACFIGEDLNRYTAKQHAEIIRSFPKGHAASATANHYQSMMYSVVKYLRGIDDDQFVTLPDEFIPTMVDEVQRKNPTVARRLLDEYRGDEDVDWYKEFGILAEGAQAMSDWITGSRNYENFDDYADGFETILDHLDDVKRFVGLMHSGPVIAKFLSDHDDDETVDKIISLVVSSPDGAIQAGELVRSLGEM